MILALWVVYALRALYLSPTAIGVIFALGSLGAVGGALLVSRCERAFGRSRVLLGAVAISSGAFLLIPLASGPTWLVASALILAFALNDAGQAATNIVVKTTRQELIAPEILGRVMATFTLFSLGAIPLGALCSGMLQTLIGMRAKILCAGIGSLQSILWVMPLLAPHHWTTLARAAR